MLGRSSLKAGEQTASNRFPAPSRARAKLRRAGRKRAAAEPEPEPAQPEEEEEEEEAEPEPEPDEPEPDPEPEPEPAPEPEPEPEVEEPEPEGGAEAEQDDEDEDGDDGEEAPDEDAAPAPAPAPAAAAAAPRPKLELPKPARREPVERAVYTPPPQMEGGPLYQVGDARLYLESTVLSKLSQALDDLSVARPASVSHYLGNHMAGNDTGEKPTLDPKMHLADALNFDYFASIAPMVTRALSDVNKERADDPMAALSRALLSTPAEAAAAAAPAPAPAPAPSEADSADDGNSDQDT